MNAVTWIIQGILAVAYVMAGVMKSTQPPDKLVNLGLKWVGRLKVSTVRFIGISELLGAIGLILPEALDVYPILTPIAASGLSLLMLLASVHHLKHKEKQAAIFTFVLMLLAVFVAFERYLFI